MKTTIKKYFLSVGVFLLTQSVFAKSFSLPLFKEKAEELGYELPEPFGINLSYMDLSQSIMVDKVGFSGIQVTKQQLIDMGIKPAFVAGALVPYAKEMIQGIEMYPEKGRQKTRVLTLRADMWLFPFLNLYVVGGKMTGTSETAVNYQLPAFQVPKGLQLILGSLEGAQAKGRIDRFNLNLDGYLYGAGFVLAGGNDQIFALLDANYTQSKLTIIDGTIDSFVVSPRVGYNFHNFDFPLRIWVGAMYQNVEQKLSGKLANLGLPNQLNLTIYDKMGKPINLPMFQNGQISIPTPKDGRFQVAQRLVTKWNPLFGFQYQVNKNLAFLAEGGFGDRKSFFATVDIRF